MKIKRLQIIYLLILLHASASIACSCERLYFCEYLKDEDKKVVFRAIVGNYKEYSRFNTAVYLEVTDIYRDDVGITEVIKLYGSTESADCHIDWLTKLSVGTEVFIAMGIEYNGQNVGFDYVNPDNLYEDFWEFAPNLCTTIILNSDAKNVYGWITPSIIEYPTEAFLLGLENCDFSLEELNMYRCTDIDFVLYPNPAKDGMIEIKNSYISTAIQSIRIINLAGKIVYFEEFNKDPFQKASIKFANSGFYIMEIHCNENIEYRKFLVE